MRASRNLLRVFPQEQTIGAAAIDLFIYYAYYYGQIRLRDLIAGANLPLQNNALLASFASRAEPTPVSIRN